jgi:hypothetical protein
VKIILLFYLAAVILAGCIISTTLNPKVTVLPGRNKSPAAFAADQVACRQFADQQIAEARNETLEQLTEQMKQEGEGGPMVPDSAVTSAIAALQRPYDAAYSQCMYAKGNLVPGYTPPAPVVQIPPNPVRRRQIRHHHVPHKAEPATAPTFVEPSTGPQPAPATFAEPPPAR